MAEARPLKFCNYGEYTKSCQRDEKSPIKAHVAHFCMHNCGVTNNFPRHSVSCDQQCRRRRTTAYRTYGDQGHTKV